VTARRGDDHPTYSGIGNPMEYEIVTGEDLPAPGHYVGPKYDVDSYFIAKWKAEGFREVSALAQQTSSP
jgi:hypothetical protein